MKKFQAHFFRIFSTLTKSLLNAQQNHLCPQLMILFHFLLIRF